MPKNSIKQKLDRYGYLSDMEKLINNEKARIKEELKPYIESFSGTETHKLEGNEYDLTLTKESDMYDVEDNNAVYKMLGKKDFLKVVKVSIAQLRLFTDAKQFKMLTVFKGKQRKLIAKRKAAKPTVIELTEEHIKRAVK